MKNLLSFLQKKKKWVIIALVLLLMPFLLELTGIYASGTWRYKMTVVVETPEGIKEGSVVREVSNSASNIKIFGLPDVGNPADFRGESVVVDLGKRGVLFTLLDLSPYQSFYHGFRKYSGASTVEGIRYFNEVPIGKEYILDPKYYPTMVMFEDIKDPTSIQLAYQHGRYNAAKEEDNLETLFGEGVRIKEIRMQKTHDQVTHKVDQYLPSYSQNNGFREWYNSLPYGDPKKIIRRNFVKQEK